MQGASSGQLGIFELLGGSNLEGSVVWGESLANGIEMDSNSSYFASSWISPGSHTPFLPPSLLPSPALTPHPPQYIFFLSAKAKHDKQGVAAGEDHRVEIKC